MIMKNDEDDVGNEKSDGKNHLCKTFFSIVMTLQEINSIIIDQGHVLWSNRYLTSLLLYWISAAFCYVKLILTKFVMI